MRSAALAFALAGCDVLFRADAVTPIDARGDAPPPCSLAPVEFVQVQTSGCTNAATCATPLLATRPGDIVIVTLTYVAGASVATTVTDDIGTAYRRIVPPVAWRFYQTEVWVAVPAASASTVTVKLPAPIDVDVYVDEYVAAAVVATAVASGTDPPITSGARELGCANDLVFGHGEGDAVTIGGGGGGFTVRTTAFSNIEEDAVVAAPGSYDASFSAASGTPPYSWVAILVGLRGG